MHYKIVKLYLYLHWKCLVGIKVSHSNSFEQASFALCNTPNRKEYEGDIVPVADDYLFINRYTRFCLGLTKEYLG